MSEPGAVRVEVEGSVGTIWLDRPDKRNAMTYAMWAQLESAAQSLGADPAVRVVLLRARGAHFCAGADITELRAERAPGERSFSDTNMAAETALATLSKPTIAVIHGDCIGGGCALAIDCDMRLADNGARFGITPSKLGIVYPTPSLERAARLLSPSAAKHLLFTGELIDAERALRIGLIDELHREVGLDARVAELAATLAERSLLTQAATKEMIAAVVDTGSVPADVSARWQAIAAAAADPAEGIAAFVERRPPKFTWPAT